MSNFARTDNSQLVCIVAITHHSNIATQQKTHHLSSNRWVPAAGGRPGLGLKDTDPSQIDEEALQNVGRMLDSGVLLREEAFSVSFDKYYVRVSF